MRLSKTKGRRDVDKMVQIIFDADFNVEELPPHANESGECKGVLAASKKDALGKKGILRRFCEEGVIVPRRVLLLTKKTFSLFYESDRSQTALGPFFSPLEDFACCSKHVQPLNGKNGSRNGDEVEKQ